jgi:hypothetical protein
MFNPEFRIMFTQEADNEFMSPNNRSIEMIFLISVITLIFVIGVSYIAYTSLLLGIQLINNIWHLLPNSILTPGNEFLEIGLILLSLAAAGFMFSAMKGFSELIDGKIQLPNLFVCSLNTLNIKILSELASLFSIKTLNKYCDRSSKFFSSSSLNTFTIKNI